LRFVANRLAVMVVLGACAAEPPPAESPSASSYLYVWAADEDNADTDFLAALDVAEDSPTYGEVVATVPVGVTGIMAHHTELRLGSDRMLFANAYSADRTWVFDLTEPGQPAMVRELDPIEGYHHLHSFWRHPDGRVYGTLQFGDSSRPGMPGGLAEFGVTGDLIRVVSSSDPAFPGEPIRTYALDASPEADVLVTTSAPMDDEATADVIQVWRLSDLTLRHTIKFPQKPDSSHVQPFEVRVIGEGDQALVNTWMCGFYLVDGLTGDSPTVEQVMVFGSPRGEGCSVPAVVGHYMIMPVARSHFISVVDISDPRNPRQVSRIDTEESYFPHWASADPLSDRVVFSDGHGDSYGIRLARVDAETGEFRWEETFTYGEGQPGISFNRSSWPHGDTGPAKPHGVVFGP